MASRCPNCGKKSMMANKRKLLRGNYNPVNRYRKNVNLQWTHLNGKRIQICTSCIKSLTKVPAGK
ncbi:MAG: hypothetical protein A3I92_00825 [Candidatus Yanofskybacteria bacterium RIFCSPLOWO2_02_FULL_43_10b]|uniref:50S ribosomal protein L28 n=1 Tax=Candidatus Yanofskybacteria bacterium RIFCSPLOWO2_02_FULL_43_10b TaxID=1802704 RepID=A0A1F8H5G7_9BACT|nr:MAG: hypothetical protein A3I92_00825 [Candidatus Yanofskybacteria bacterium RIFCSPLOWO2_02_FULL_43_10b]